MKLLLWTCILCVAFAKRKRFHAIDEKVLLPTSEVYKVQRPPMNPSLNIPYPRPNKDFSPPEKKFHHYPENPNFDTGIPPNSWILNNPGAAAYNIPNIPIPTWLPPHRPTPPGPAAVLPFPKITGGLEDSSGVPAAAESYIAAALEPKPTTVAPRADKLQYATAESDEFRPTTATTPAKGVSDEPAASEPENFPFFEEVRRLILSL